MTQQLEQKEAIEVLGNIKILPEDYNFKVVNCNRDRVVCRTYYIDKNSTKYPFLNRIVVEYKMNISTERITDYSVYLTNDSGDILYTLRKMIEKNINTSKILNKFHMYINTNGIVPTEIWKHQLFS